MKKRFVAMLACALAALLLLPATAFAQNFTPNARLDEDGVLHWDAEGEYYSRIDLFPLMFGPSSADHCAPSVDGEYSYDIENLFQMAEQFYPIAGDIDGLNGSHPVTFVYYEKQQDGTMKEVGRAEGTYSYSYRTGELVQLATPSNLSWTEADGFTASWGSVDHAEGYLVRFYEAGSTSQAGEANVEGTTCALTSAVPTPKDGATYTFEVRALRPAADAQYTNSEWSGRSAASDAWETPVVEYGLFVGDDVEVTSENAADVLGDGSVSYDPDSQTLTLEDATIVGTGTSDHHAAIERVAYDGPDSLTIELVGTSSCGSIVIGGNADDPCPLTIAGEGSLTVFETTPAGAISVQGDITVDGATLTVTAAGNGIQANSSSIAIKNGAKVDASATGDNGYMALSAGGDVEVTGAGTRLVASTADADGHYAVIAHNGTVTIGEGAYVEAHGVVQSEQQLTVKGKGTVLQAEGTASGKTAVNCQASISVEDGAQVKATGRFYGKNGISVADSSLTVNSIGNDYAIDARGPIAVSNSTLNATCEETVAVYIWEGDGALTLTDSTVTVTSSNSFALYALAGGIEVSGGSLTLNAPKSYAAYTTGDLTVKDGTQLTLTDVVYGLAATGTVKLSGVTGKVTAGDAALYSGGKDVVIENCSDLMLSGKMTVNAKGGVSISGSSLNVSGTDAIYAGNDVVVIDSKIEVDATLRPIAGGSVAISGETTDINATGGWYIGANDELTISGGKVTIDVTTDPNERVMGALYGNDAVRISGGTVNATVSKSDDDDVTYALMTNGVAEFTGGTVTLEGDTGAIYVSKNGGSVSFGSNSEWYQWATSPTGEVVLAEDDPYSYDEDKSTYLRIEPAVPLYELRVQGGTGGGMYAEGTKVTISAVEYDDYGHFTGWYVVDTGGGDFEDWHDATTIFTMPASDTNVVAGYEEHTLVHHDAKAPTCTEPGWEAYVTCEACAYTTYKEIPATGHTYEDGACVDCGEEDPDYVAPEGPAEPSDGGSGSEDDGAIPATGDAAVLAVGVPAALGAVALAAGAVVRRRR